MPTAPGLQDRRGAAGGAGAGELARRRSAPPGLLILGCSCSRTTWCGWSARTACRASWCRLEGRRGARHRLRRGGLFARAGRLRVRHRHAALHLFLDDHAAAGLRLRHGDARAHLRKVQEVPSGHDPDDYVTRRILARRPRRRGGAGLAALPQGHAARRHGAAAALRLRLLRHGHPGRPSTPTAVLVDRGFVYAIAHIRGGTDKGYRWYLDGKREQKVNTFTDFIAAAEGLIAEGSPRRAASSATAARPAAC
jgi:hypothetical protein